MLGLILIALAFFFAFSQTQVGQDTISSIGEGIMQLLGVSLPQWEIERILAVAESYGVDPRFLAALRKAENGGPGREYGVLSVSAPTYDEQLRVAANTVRHTVTRYETNTGQNAIGPGGRYTEDFIRYFSSGGPGYGGYAPIGAGNDPGGLNLNHAANLAMVYGGTDIATA